MLNTMGQDCKDEKLSEQLPHKGKKNSAMILAKVKEKMYMVRGTISPQNTSWHFLNE